MTYGMADGRGRVGTVCVWVTYHQLLCRWVRVTPFPWKFCRAHYPVTPRKTDLGNGRIAFCRPTVPTCDYIYLIYVLTFHFLGTPTFVYSAFHFGIRGRLDVLSIWSDQTKFFPALPEEWVATRAERGGRHYTRMTECSKWNTTIWSTIWEKMGCLQLHVSVSNVSHFMW